MHQRYRVWHSLNGYEVELYTVSWWREVLTLVCEQLDVWSGHRLCYSLYFKALEFEDRSVKCMHQFVVTAEVARALGAQKLEDNEEDNE